MHLVLLDRWNELDSPLHRLDPRSKIAAVGAVVLFVVLSSAGLGLKLPAAAGFLLLLLALSRVPPGYCLKHAAMVLPFSGMALLAALAGRWLSGPGARHWISPEAATLVVIKSYLAALAMLLLAATTRLPAILGALERWHVPAPFLMIVQFLYRYLFVLSEEAQHMAYAQRGRSAGAGRAALFRAARGALGVLFLRSYARAERVHRAMLSRGFTGTFPLRGGLEWRSRDSAFLVMAAAFLAAAEAASVWMK